jgi:hypothetical protein
MEFLAGMAVVVIATFVTTWFNDHVSKAEYLADE